MRRFLAPEVVQTSAMDCGPATLKCLLEGFGISASYGRLREACQTGLDGTCIDTLEEVANQLGLQAEQISIPADHLLASEAKTLPAIVMTTLPGGTTHFVVVWRRHGNKLQVMDPGVGRRWVRVKEFQNEVYRHTMPVLAEGWREFAASDDFQRVLAGRLRRIGVGREQSAQLRRQAIEGESWRDLAALDAATRLLSSLMGSGALSPSGGSRKLLERFCAQPELIPARFWSVREGVTDSEGQEQVLMQGAVLVRVLGRQKDTASEALSTELKAALGEKPVRPLRELLSLLQTAGGWAALFLPLGLGAIAGGLMLEALLFRGLFDVTSELGLAGQRLGAMTALIAFSFLLLLLEFWTFLSGARMGRALEMRLRVAFLSKIPKLGDRYFQSRLTSDMAERSHSTNKLRHLPDMLRQLLHACFELCATAAGIIWLEPFAALFVVPAVSVALLPALITQPMLAERDLRVRSHAAGLTRFYLDAMLGLQAIRAHGAEQNIRRAHETLLGEWAHAALRLQRAVVGAESVQVTLMFACIASMFLLHPLGGAEIGRVLLLVYWALNLPVVGQEIASLTRQYPYYRNLTLRLLEPLGAAEEESAGAQKRSQACSSSAPGLQFCGVSAEAAGNNILQEIDLNIEAGAHVALVGTSGAGKSSLVGLLLGWLHPSAGAVLVDGAPLDVEQLRHSTAWVDPAVQIWNRSLFTNLSYGAEPDMAAIGRTIDAVMLRNVLENLPEGLQTKLGEAGGLVSGGEGQRVRLGRAMARNHARLVILDEPFRGLDREKRRELLLRARELWRDCTLLCITHDVSETQTFDQVLVIERGRLVEEGRPDELLKAEESRYAQLLQAEEQTRRELWDSPLWRRLSIHAGRIVEELPRTLPEKQREAEVA